MATVSDSPIAARDPVAQLNSIMGLFSGGSQTTTTGPSTSSTKSNLTADQLNALIADAMAPLNQASHGAGLSTYSDTNLALGRAQVAAKIGAQTAGTTTTESGKTATTTKAGTLTQPGALKSLATGAGLSMLLSPVLKGVSKGVGLDKMAKSVEDTIAETLGASQTPSLASLITDKTGTEAGVDYGVDYATTGMEPATTALSGEAATTDAALGTILAPDAALTADMSGAATGASLGTTAADTGIAGGTAGATEGTTATTTAMETGAGVGATEAGATTAADMATATTAGETGAAATTAAEAGGGGDVIASLLADAGVPEELAPIAEVATKIICTESLAQGLVSQELYDAERLHLSKNTPNRTVMRGYHFLATPIVLQMRKHKSVAKFFAFFAKGYMEHMTGSKKNLVGAFVKYAIIPISFAIGLFITEDNDLSLLKVRGI